MEEIEIYEIDTLDNFDNNLTRLVKKKKFFSLSQQIRELKEDVRQGKFESAKLTHSDFPTPHDVYKLRLPNLDTNAGKSNGYRVIYMALTENKVVVLMTIYYKKEKPSISDDYITALIDGYFLNLLKEE